MNLDYMDRIRCNDKRRQMPFDVVFSEFSILFKGSLLFVSFTF